LDNGGSPITGYTVTASPVSGGTPIAVTGTTSPITVTGLTNGTDYSITVTAANKLGTGSAGSSAAVIIPGATPATIPGATTDVVVTKTSNGVLVSFTPPADNGGSSVTGYTVIASPVNGGTTIQTAGKSSPIAVTGLTVGMSYSVSVLATNANGTATATSGSSSAQISYIGTLAQSISINPLVDRPSDSDPFSLQATASSGLPVSLAITSGPAFLSGDRVTLTGGVGVVSIRASQAGNGIYAAAGDVTTSFRIFAAPVNVFFGTVSGSTSNAKVGDVAAVLTPKTGKGSMLIVAPSVGFNTSLTFVVDGSGSFNSVFTSTTQYSAFGAFGVPPRAAAPVQYTVSGRLINGRIQGVISPSGITFDSNVLSTDGPSASAAGFYEATALGAGSGKAYAVVGTGNQVLSLAATPEVTIGALTQLKSDFSVDFSGQLDAARVGVNLQVDPASSGLAGGIDIAGKSSTRVAGTLSTTIANDRVINLSSRGIAGSGHTFISGFVISGLYPKRVLLRAAGPALTAFGLPRALANPKLRVYDSDGRVILENDDWAVAESAAATTQVGAFSLIEGSKDAAILATLNPGAYTIHVISSDPEGVALAEVYDASLNPNGDSQKLSNISTRGEVTAGDGTLIGGFVVTGNSPAQVLVRGVGPSLSMFGLAGVLSDPRLRIYRGNDLIAENDDWGSNGDQATSVKQAANEVGAFSLMNGSKDAALVLTVAPGVYTVQVTAAVGSSGGTALVEVYQMSR
jgi:hypothetical protein